VTDRGCAADKVLVVRTCCADMTAYGGFRWPESGPVMCPDWDPQPDCGGGLHGLAWGVGEGSLLDWSDDARWLLVEAPAEGLVDLRGKIKFPAGRVVACGDRAAVLAELERRAPHVLGLPVVGATRTAGYRGIATAGYRGTATAGDGGTATVGDRGIATVGDRGTATAAGGGTATAGGGGTAIAGYGGTATAGDGGIATAGDEGTAIAGGGGIATAGDAGTATAGDRGTATAGDEGTATAGYQGIATAGDAGTATAGYGGIATAGDGGTATAGDGGTVCVWWRYGGRRRLVVGYVGEDGVLPDTPYQVTGGRLVVAS